MAVKRTYRTLGVVCEKIVGQLTVGKNITKFIPLENYGSQTN